MNNKLSCLLAFSLGAAVGSVASWKMLKTKYKRIADEEIASVKERFTLRKTVDAKCEEEKQENSDIPEEVSEENEDMDEYKSMINQLGYASESDDKAKEAKTEMPTRPYVIPPESFGECDYETVSLTYYADKVLTDEDDNVIENVDDLVGEDSLNHFGEFEDDSVFVRNNKKKCDYEILLDMRKYSDVKKRYSPQQMED